MQVCGGAEVRFHTFLTSTLDGGHRSASYPGHFSTSSHFIGDWVDPTAGVDAMVKKKMPFACHTSNPDPPAYRLVTILTELSWVLLQCFLSD